MAGRDHIKRTTFTLAVLPLIAACGGGGGDSGPTSNTPPPPPAPPAVQTGVFKDANVSGLELRVGRRVRHDRWRRPLHLRDRVRPVTFGIGAIELGTADCAARRSCRRAWSASGALDDVETVNRARLLLQMLDIDGDPTNGIEISSDVQTIAENWVQPDFGTADLAMEIAAIISDAFSVDGTAHDLPDPSAASAHLQSQTECAYAGAFSGSMSGGLSGAVTVYIGAVGASPAFQPGYLEWIGFDAGEDFTAFGGGSNSVVYAARPVIDHSGTNLSGPHVRQFPDSGPDHRHVGATQRQSHRNVFGRSYGR